MTDVPPPSWDWFYSLLIAKIIPAGVGAVLRNLFPPRKSWSQKLLETFGAVLFVIYAGQVAAGAQWALLSWGMGHIGVTDISRFIDRAESDRLSALLVGLLGMTAVEGCVVWIRRRAAGDPAPPRDQ